MFRYYLVAIKEIVMRFGRLAAVCCLLMGITFGTPVDSFTGHYVLVKDASQDVQQAIEQAIAPMNFLVRPIARRQLRPKTVVYPSFAMENSGNSLHITLPGVAPLSLPLSGAAIPWRTPDGETVQVHLVLEQDLVQVFESKSGRREDRFTLSPDRQGLTMKVRITSRELPRPLEYRLIYRRVSSSGL